MGIGAAIGGIAGGLLSSRAAGKAADAQEAAAGNQLALESRIYDETVERFEPFLGAGNNALKALQFELGLGERPTFGGTAPSIEEFTDTTEGPGANWTPRFAGDTPPQGANQAFQIANGQNEGQIGWMPSSTSRTRYRVGDQVFDSREAAQEFADANPTGGTEYQGFKETPGYQFNLDQGLNAIDNSAASRGNLFSGATMKAAQEYGAGLASNEYNNYFNRLTGMASSGQAAAGNAANAGANYAAGAGNAYAGIGNAASAGAIGQANAINSGINNAIGGFNYQNQLANSSGGGMGGLFSLFSGPAPGSANSFGGF